MQPYGFMCTILFFSSRQKITALYVMILAELIFANINKKYIMHA